MQHFLRQPLSVTVLVGMALSCSNAQAQTSPTVQRGAPDVVFAQPTPSTSVLSEPLACDARKGHLVEWSPWPNAGMSDRLRDDLWNESNLHGYLRRCDAITLLPGLDRIQASMEDPSHRDQLQCLWDMGLLGAERQQPMHDATSGAVLPLPVEVVNGVLSECVAAASAHHDGYLHDQVQELNRWSRQATDGENNGTTATLPSVLPTATPAFDSRLN